MTYEWLIAKRYLWSKRRHPFVGVMSTISVLGITVGVAALIVVLAVMNGFDEDLKSRIIGTHAHLVMERDGVFENWAAVAEDLKKTDTVKGAAPFVEGQALIQSAGLSSGVLVRGIDFEKEKAVSRFHDYVKEGSISIDESSAIIGSELAKRFHLGLDSEILLVVQNVKKPRAFKVRGIFSSGMYEYDANLLFLNLNAASELFKMNGSVSGLSIALKDADAARTVKETLQKKFGYPYFLRTWMDMNKTLFGALKLEKLVMFLILGLIIFVACLNIAGSLTILVIDKTKDVGILKALGASSQSLRGIFALSGVLMGILGALAGCAVGVGVCVLLKHTSFIELPKEIYYLDRLPVALSQRDVFSVTGLAVGLSLLSSFYPAKLAAQLDPIKALRYE
jgi:lipoprotein-releasing system permease protein